MPLEVAVSPPLITINHGNTFLLSALDGSILQASDQGFYARDTRYISLYRLYINGQPWTLLNSGAIAYYASRRYLVNPSVSTEHGEILPDPPRQIARVSAWYSVRAARTVFLGLPVRR